MHQRWERCKHQAKGILFSQIISNYFRLLPLIFLLNITPGLSTGESITLKYKICDISDPSRVLFHRNARAYSRCSDAPFPIITFINSSSTTHSILFEIDNFSVARVISNSVFCATNLILEMKDHYQSPL